MNDFEQWYKQLPIVTRTYMSVVVLTTFLISFGIINPYYLVLNFDNKMQVIFIICIDLEIFD